MWIRSAPNRRHENVLAAVEGYQRKLEGKVYGRDGRQQLTAMGKLESLRLTGNAAANG